MVMAHALFRQLKHNDPAGDIQTVAPPWVLPLVDRMPEISRGWALEVGHGETGISKRRQLARDLKAQNFDQAIVLPNSFKSALVPFFAAIPKRRGYRGEMRYGLINEMHRLDKSVLPRTVERFAALASHTALNFAPDIMRPKLTVTPDMARQVADEMKLSTGKPIIALCPGAEYGPAKQWPLDYYAGLAQRLTDTGRNVWIFGSGKDQDAGNQIQRQAGQADVHNLCGRTNLTQAIDLMSLCQKVVTNDSGLMHIAAALDIPLVALFGSSTPDMTPPLSDKAKILAMELDCRPCFKRECPLGHLDCLNKISVDQVYSSL